MKSLGEIRSANDAQVEGWYDGHAGRPIDTHLPEAVFHYYMVGYRKGYREAFGKDLEEVL
jgi:hypothetical protein